VSWVGGSLVSSLYFRLKAPKAMEKSGMKRLVDG
jgi:hypothetical protein